MLGGCSSINFMLYIRGLKSDFTEWAALGNPGWDYDGVLPYFKKCENNLDESLVKLNNGYYHSAKGPVKVSSNNASEFNELIIKGLEENGFAYIPDINASRDTGIFMAQSTCANGRRSSTATSYLLPAKHRKNFHIMKYSYVDEIILNKENKAIGVAFTYKGQHKMKAFCKKEVIVSAGTIQSPPLLMRSGIGPKKHLEQRKVRCKADLDVGKNLYDHLFITMNFSFNVSKTPLPPTIYCDCLYEYITKNDGPFASLPILSGRVNPTNGNGAPGIQVYYLTVQRGDNQCIGGLYSLLQLDDLLQDNCKTLAQKDILMIVLSLSKPKSSGEIKLNENVTRVDPIIEPNYLYDPRDRALVLQAIKQQWNLMKKEYFQKLGMTFMPVSIPECNKIERYSDAYWNCYMDYISVTGNITM